MEKNRKMLAFRSLIVGLFALLFIALLGCGSSVDRQEVAVYAAFVDSHFTTVADSSEPLKRHVICDHTCNIQMCRSWREAISKLSVVPDVDAIANFASRNFGNYPESALNDETMKFIGRYPLNPHIRFKLPHRLIPEAMVDKLFADGGGGWLEFNERYRKSHGILWLSRVGFNKDQSQALLYVGNVYTEAAGEGRLVLLQKQGRLWKEVASAICWIS